MKNVTLSTLFVLLFSTASLSQSAVIEYRQKTKLDDNKISQYLENIKKIVLAKTKWTSALLIQKDETSVYLIDKKVVV